MTYAHAEKETLKHRQKTTPHFTTLRNTTLHYTTLRYSLTGQD